MPLGRYVADGLAAGLATLTALAKGRLIAPRDSGLRQSLARCHMLCPAHARRRGLRSEIGWSAAAPPRTNGDEA